MVNPSPFRPPHFENPSDSSNINSLSERETEIELRPHIITRLFAVAIAFLTIAQIFTLFLRFYLGYKNALGFVPAFDFDTEGNFPSLYSACGLFFCSILLGVISIHAKKKANHDYVYWMLLAILFLFLCFDEGAIIHERFQGPVRHLIGNSFFFNFEWAVLYILIFGFIGLFFLKFFLQLPKKTKIIFIISAFVFLSGALGMEAIGTKIYFQKSEIGYAICYTIEEFLEMVGVLIYIYALLDYITIEKVSIKFK